MYFLRTSKTLCVVIVLGLSLTLSAPAIHAQSLSFSPHDANASTALPSLFDRVMEWLTDWTIFDLGDGAEAVDPGILDFNEGEGGEEGGGDGGSGLDPLG